MGSYEDGICTFLKIDPQENLLNECRYKISLKPELLENYFEDIYKDRLGDISDEFLNEGSHACKTVRHKECDEDFVTLFGRDKLSSIMYDINNIRDCEEACDNYPHINSCGYYIYDRNEAKCYIFHQLDGVYNYEEQWKKTCKSTGISITQNSQDNHSDINPKTE